MWKGGDSLSGKVWKKHRKTLSHHLPFSAVNAYRNWKVENIYKEKLLRSYEIIEDQEFKRKHHWKPLQRHIWSSWQLQWLGKVPDPPLGLFLPNLQFSPPFPCTSFHPSSPYSLTSLTRSPSAHHTWMPSLLTSRWPRFWIPRLASFSTLPSVLHLHPISTNFSPPRLTSLHSSVPLFLRRPSPRRLTLPTSSSSFKTHFTHVHSSFLISEAFVAPGVLVWRFARKKVS